MLLSYKHWLALVWLAFFVTACSEKIEMVTLSGHTMGTTYHIKLVPNDTMPKPEKLQQAIDLALEQVNDQMSTYRTDSELSRFNQHVAKHGLPVSTDTLKVVKEGIKLHQITQGALDISLGPLVNLWGFGPDARPTQIPTQAQINKVKTETGLQALSIDGNKLVKLKPKLYLDLSSIAKGFGVDKVAAILNHYHIDNYLVEIGGEVMVKGTKIDGTPWRIAIEKPTTDTRAVQQVIEPKNMAMATSGDYRNYYEEDGQRFSHIIDPRTGYPINHKLVSVTVLAPTCMEADGYATAMMVLGAKAALKLAQKQHLAVLLIEKQESGFKVEYSDAFKPYLRNES